MKQGHLEISNNKNKLDLSFVHHYLSNQSYWAKGRTLETIQKSIENSVCFGVYRDGIQVGFARVITDYATIAHLSDVFIDEKHRSQGLAMKLLEYIFSSPDLQNIYRWMLGTRDAHELYKKFGFSPCAHPDRIMEKVKS